MTIKEMIKQAKEEKKRIMEEIRYLEKEIERKENEDVFIANTLYEKAQLRRLYEKLR